MSSLESRIEKLEASKPIDAAAEAAIIMKQIDRACDGLPADQVDSKIAAILKFVPDEVLEVIANLPTEDSNHE